MPIEDHTERTVTPLIPQPLAPAWQAGPLPARAVLNAIARIRRGTLSITLPDGTSVQVGEPESPQHAHITITDYRFAWPIVFGGHLGAAEAFLSGYWESDNVEAVLELFSNNREAFEGALGGTLLHRLVERTGHWLRRNTPAGSRRNIHEHYDLGNAFYKRWLDPSMTYSSARFNQPSEGLSDAQRNKYRSLAERIDLKPGEHLLEIGCGWGGFAEFAAKEYQCRVTGLTISEEQLAFARQRMFENGLTDKVDIRFQDYRDVDEKFDKIASIEMFEAVGEEYWPHYFSKVHDSLRPNGLAGLQIITIADSSFDSYRRGVDFIQRYIFPGGMLPSPAALKEQVASAGLEWKGSLEFGLDYAETLARWRDRFLAAWPEIRTMGFDERFRRMWEFYLAYCEAGFRTGNIDVTQLTLQRH